MSQRTRQLRTPAEVRADLQRAYLAVSLELQARPGDPFLLWERNVLAARIAQLDAALSSR